MFFLKVHDGVRKWIVGDVQRFAEYLETVSPSKHRICIELCPAPAVAVYGDKSGECGFGVFIRRLVKCGIAIACDWLPYRKDGISGRADARRLILESLAHEWCHYERFRDGRPDNHRGVERRTRCLVDRFLGMKGGE